MAHSSHLEHSVPSALESGSGTGWSPDRGNSGTSGRCPRQERLSVWGTCSSEVLRAVSATVVEEPVDTEAHTQGNSSSEHPGPCLKPVT